MQTLKFLCKPVSDFIQSSWAERGRESNQVIMFYRLDAILLKSRRGRKIKLTCCSDVGIRLEYSSGNSIDGKLPDATGCGQRGSKLLLEHWCFLLTHLNEFKVICSYDGKSCLQILWQHFWQTLHHLPRPTLLYHGQWPIPILSETIRRHLHCSNHTEALS